MQQQSQVQKIVCVPLVQCLMTSAVPLPKHRYFLQLSAVASVRLCLLVWQHTWYAHFTYLALLLQCCDMLCKTLVCSPIIRGGVSSSFSSPYSCRIPDYLRATVSVPCRSPSSLFSRATCHKKVITPGGQVGSLCICHKPQPKGSPQYV